MIKNGLAQRSGLTSGLDRSKISSDAEPRIWPFHATFSFVVFVNLAAWTGLIALGFAVL